MGSVALSRLRAEGALDTIQVSEPIGSIDRDGNQPYSDPQPIVARVRVEDREVLTAEGARIQTQLSLTVPAGEAPLPGRRWRVEHAGETFVVEWLKHVRLPRGELALVRYRCRRA